MARIIFYGRLADLYGREVALDVDVAGVPVSMLRKCFSGLDPATVRACINGETAGEDELVKPHDLVDFLPPLSGG